MPEPRPATPTFGEIVERSLAVLERRHRVSHTALRLEFALDDATFAALREELVDVLCAAEDDGRILTALDHPTTHAGQLAAAPVPEAPALISVLLCDLDENADLQSLRPDERAQITARFHEICGEVAARLRGHLQPWVSDGVAIFFGHPRPQDDDAVRALRCGWEILRTLAAVRAAIQNDFGVRVSARLGLATGATADDGADAFGDTPRVAGRVQAAGTPDTLTVDAATQARTNGHFAFSRHDHDGLYVVSAPLDPSAGRRHAPTPLVGRIGERALLQALAERAAGGTRSAVLIRGEAGIGKSRLLGALAESASDTLGMTVLHCAASPAHRGSPLHPVLTGLRRHGIALPDTITPSTRMSPGRRRRETFKVLADVLAAEARSAPLLLVIEDLHWADPTTIELIGTLLDGPREVALMLGLTARSEFLAPASTALQRIQLGRLDKDESRRVVELAAAGGTLPDGAAAQLGDRAGGSPLLAEELTRTALALQDAGPATATTLFASLLARLDRDSTTRGVAQLAATIGREFDVTLLEAAGGIERSALDWGLERLVEERVVASTGPGSYAFRHALLQEAARSSLGQESLRDHNLRIARALMLSFPHVAEAEPERVARHLEYAAELPEAAEHWRRAGLQALDQHALAEATGHFERGLKLMARTADGDDRRAEELSLRVLAGQSIAMRLSWSAPAAIAHYERAEQLAARVKDCKQLVPSMLRLTTHRLIEGRVEDALALARRQIAVAQTARDRELVAEAECEAGGALVQLGRHREAFSHLNRAIELYDCAHNGGHAPRFGRDPAAISLGHRGLVLACRDDRAGARDAIAEAAAILRAHPHPYSQAWVLCVAAASALICDQREVVLREAAAAIAIATEEGFDDLLRQASVLHGWARVRSGEMDAGLEECRRGAALSMATGAAVLRPFAQGLLGDALARAGEFGQGIAAIDAALVWSARGERWCEPELHRIRADVLLRAGDRPNALRSAQAAVALARRSNAAGWERRAAHTLRHMSSTAPVSQR